LHRVSPAGVQSGVQLAAQTAGSAVSSQTSLVSAQSVPSCHNRQPSTSVQVWITVPEHRVSSSDVQVGVQPAAQTAGSAVSSQTSLVSAQSVPSCHWRHPPPTSVQVWITVPEHCVSPAVVQSGVQVEEHSAVVPVSTHDSPVSAQSSPRAQTRHPSASASQAQTTEPRHSDSPAVQSSTHAHAGVSPVATQVWFVPQVVVEVQTRQPFASAAQLCTLVPSVLHWRSPAVSQRSVSATP
jgi:hypothetical protein